MSRFSQQWSEREDATLSKLYLSYGVNVCKERLGRSAAAVYARAFQLGLTARQPDAKTPASRAVATRR